MADAYPRFNQISHGFKQLTAVVVESGGWRRATPGQRFHLIVARVYGPDTFAGVTIGEIDGLSGIVRGQFYGVNGAGDLQPGVVPVVAIGCGPGSVVVVGDGENGITIPDPIDTSIFEQISNKGAADGYAPLDSTAKVPLANLPTDYLLNPQNLDLSKVLVDKENGTFVMDTSTDPTTFVIP